MDHSASQCHRWIERARKALTGGGWDRAKLEILYWYGPAAWPGKVEHRCSLASKLA